MAKKRLRSSLFQRIHARQEVLKRLYGRTPKPLTGRRLPVEGHRGIAAGSLTPGEEDISDINVEEWEKLSKGEMQGFLVGEPLRVHSSNVAVLQWFEEPEQLFVEFKDRSVYLYQPVKKAIAMEFLRALSKGGAVWDYLRIRGTMTGHRVNYQRVR